MNAVFLYHGQQFTWDLEKAATNLAKHGVAFEHACEVFFDPFVRIEDGGTDEEQREAAIGLTEDWNVLYVIHLMREGETIRIVSARIATAQERRRYEDE